MTSAKRNSDKSVVVPTQVSDSLVDKDLGLPARVGRINNLRTYLDTIEPVSAALTGSGALVGGLSAGLLSKENKLRNALVGAAVGGGAGLLADYVRKRPSQEIEKVKEEVASFTDFLRDRYTAVVDRYKKKLGL